MSNKPSDEKTESKQDADAGALRGTLRYVTRYLVTTPYYLNNLRRIASINPRTFVTVFKNMHPRNLVTAFKLQRQVKRASTTVDTSHTTKSSDSTSASRMSKINTLVSKLKHFGVIVAHATPSFLRSYWMGRILMLSYGKAYTAHDYIGPSGIDYNLKKCNLIHSLNYKDLLQHTSNSTINGGIAGFYFAGFVITWDFFMSKSWVFYTNMSQAFAVQSHPSKPLISATNSVSSRLSTVVIETIKAPLSFSISGSLPVHVFVNAAMYGTYEFVKPIIYRTLHHIFVSSTITVATHSAEQFEHNMTKDDNDLTLENNKIEITRKDRLQESVRLASVLLSGLIAGTVCEFYNYYGSYLVANGFRKPLAADSVATGDGINNALTRRGGYASLADGFAYIRQKPLPNVVTLAITTGVPSALGFMAFEHGKTVMLL